MTDAEALYRELLARPDADPLRTLELLYADAVEDADRARAELIRVQCAIERDPEVDVQKLWEEECARLASSRGTTTLAIMAQWRKGPDTDTLAFLRGVDCAVDDRRHKWRERNAELRDRERALLDENRYRWLAGPLSAAILTVAYWECGFPVVRAPEFEHCWRREGVSGGFVLHPTGRMQAIAREYHVAGVLPSNLIPQRIGRGSGRERVRTFWHWPYAPEGFPEWMRTLSEREFETRDAAELALGRASVLAAIRWLDARKFDGAKP